MKKKSELDFNVATSLGENPREVAAITAAFIDEVARALVEHGSVQLPRLGKLILRFDETNRTNMMGNPCAPLNCRVHFSKSRILKEQVEEKYAQAVRRRSGNGEARSIRGSRRRSPRESSI